MPFIQTNIEKEIELKRKNNPEFKRNGMNRVQNIN